MAPAAGPLASYGVACSTHCYCPGSRFYIGECWCSNQGNGASCRPPGVVRGRVLDPLLLSWFSFLYRGVLVLATGEKAQVLDPLLLSGFSFLYRGVLVLATGEKAQVLDPLLLSGFSFLYRGVLVLATGEKAQVLDPLLLSGLSILYRGLGNEDFARGACKVLDPLLVSGPSFLYERWCMEKACACETRRRPDVH